MAGSDSEQWTWAQCEYCLKWRRLADETYIDDTQEFGCPMIGVKCEDSQEEWSEEDEDEDAMDADGGDTGLSTQEKEFAKWKTMYADNTRESPPTTTTTTTTTKKRGRTQASGAMPTALLATPVHR
jgi:hypothetical protein